jgi:hypothetical protein
VVEVILSYTLPKLVLLSLSSRVVLLLFLLGPLLHRVLFNHGAHFGRGIFRPSGGSLSPIGCSSSARYRNLGILGGSFRFHRRGLRPIKRGLCLVPVHLALIIELLAAASTSQHQGKDREERLRKAFFNKRLPHRLPPFGEKLESPLFICSRCLLAHLFHQACFSLSRRCISPVSRRFGLIR